MLKLKIQKKRTTYLAEYAALGVATETLRTRSEFIFERVLSLPVNFVEAISHLAAQRNQIYRKRKYLKRYIQIKKKIYPSVKTEIDFAEFNQYALPRIVYVSVRAANIRSGPSTMYRKIGMAYRGDMLRVIKREGRWYKVRLQTGLVGWIAERITSIDRPR